MNERSDTVLLLLNDVLSNGFDLDVFISGLAEHIRHLWVARKDNTLVLLEFNLEVKTLFVDQSKLIEEASMLNMLNIISECEVNMKTTRNRRLTVELALLKMCYLKKLMQSSWTELGEKKKSDNIVHPPSAKKLEIVPPPSAPIGNNLGIGLSDILSKVDTKLNVVQDDRLPELKPITKDNIWNLMLEKFDGTLSEKQMLLSLEPTIDQTRFILGLESASLAKMVETTFLRLKKIYTEITGDLAEFHCEVYTSNLIEDVTKKQAFEELVAKYPILYQIHETFKLDFNT